ncbi:MAG: carbohydrate kinase family protein [Candidatus Taylorbacteria bacterium]
MFKKHLDIIAIGDVTTDAFIRLQNAAIHCKVDTEACEICLPFGDKVPFEYVKIIKGVGNAANAAVAATRLGLRSALISDVGTDLNGKECMNALEKNGVITTHVTVHNNKATNYHFVLWYDVDRTILVNHVDYGYTLPRFPEPRWIYLTSMGGSSEQYHQAIAEYLIAHPQVRLAFQPGTFQMKLGIEKLKKIYERTDVFIVNVEESQRILDTHSRDIKVLLNGIAKFGPKIVLITDGPKGAYMFDGEHYYFMPIYPDPKAPFERTGCGDAFASTFMSALCMGKSPLEALTWAPVNPMSVAQFIGAQEGLLNEEQIEWWLTRAPAEYKPREI